MIKININKAFDALDKVEVKYFNLKKRAKYKDITTKN